MADSFTMTLHDTSLAPDEIERELVSMWKPIGEVSGSAQAPVSRVVLGNVIWVGLRSQIGRVRGIVQKVVPRYPCRFFLLEFDPGETGSEVRAAVSAQCFVPQKGQPPVCCELVQMTFGPAGARHLRGCVAPLLLPELQTVLWESLAGVPLPQVAELQAFADRMITQASLLARPENLLRELAVSSRPACDLAWIRMAPIREQVAAAFDDPGVRLDLRELESITIGVVPRACGSRLPELLGALLAGWIGSRLGWEPGEALAGGRLFESAAGMVRTRIQPSCSPCDDSRNHLSLIELSDRRGEQFRVLLENQGGSMDIWHGPSARRVSGRHLVLSELPEADALGNAFNRPVAWEDFRHAARLAIPLLESLPLGCHS